VAALVAVCPTIYPVPLPPEVKLLFTPIGPFLWRHVFSRRDLRREMQKRNVRDPALITSELVDYLWARLNRSGGREASYAAMVSLSKLSGNTADPGRVRAPTLLLWPEEDRMLPLALGRRLARAVPGAELRVIPAAGHDVFLERPDEVWRQLRPFLDGLTANDELDRVEAPAARSVL
jgi:pimeloyl-ACP methyl ester carboxylesterase